MTSRDLVGVVTRLERLRNSESGNPRFRVHASVDGKGVIMATATDAAVNNIIPNYVETETRLQFKLDHKGFLVDVAEA